MTIPNKIKDNTQPYNDFPFYFSFFHKTLYTQVDLKRAHPFKSMYFFFKETFDPKLCIMH